MKKVTIPVGTVVGGYFACSEFFKMSHEQFVDWCGGLLAQELFKGQFKSAVNDVVSMASARGVMYQIEKKNEK